MSTSKIQTALTLLEKVKRLLIAGFLLLAFLTNPSQNRHLEELVKSASLRDANRKTGEFKVVTQSNEYNDYFIFSTTSIGNGFLSSDYTLTYGFLGFIKTTGNISSVMYEIANWKPPEQQKSLK